MVLLRNGKDIKLSLDKMRLKVYFESSLNFESVRRIQVDWTQRIH